jgi:hypothetical protein
MNAEQAKFLVDYFAGLWEGELPATAKVLRNVPDEKRSYKPDEKSRSAWDLATHLALGDLWFIQSIIDGSFNFDPEIRTSRRSTRKRSPRSSRSCARFRPTGSPGSSTFSA